MINSGDGVGNTIEPHEIQDIIAQLDQAIASHAEWFDALTRTLICHIPYDQKDVAGDAHRHCRLGQWYYSDVPAKLRIHPGFVALEEEHAAMHRLAGDLLRKTGASEAIPTEEFDQFTGSLGRLRLQIYTLKREFENELYNLDHLTGANSRIGMLTRMREQHELVKRQVEPCSVVMMDIDRFKLVNDSHGHAAGDKVLAAAARYIMDNIRPYDKLFRYGGEEFLLCMQNTDEATAYEVIERLRVGLAELPIDCGNGLVLRVSMSFGLTQLASEVTVERSIEQADQAMYAAKAAGRNTTCIWQQEMVLSR